MIHFLSVFNLLLSLLIINSVDIGVQFGPNIPSGNLAEFYRTSTTGSVYCEFNNFQLDYNFSKFTGKINNNEYFYLHSGILSYQYPFLKNEKRNLGAGFGGSYNRILRRYATAHEEGYALGVRYGIGYKENLLTNSFLKDLRPALISNIYLNQLIHSRNWNSTQVFSSNFLFSIMVGMNFSLL